MDLVHIPRKLTDFVDVFCCRGHCYAEKEVTLSENSKRGIITCTCLKDQTKYKIDEFCMPCSIIETASSNIMVYVRVKSSLVSIESMKIYLCNSNGEEITSGLYRKGRRKEGETELKKYAIDFVEAEFEKGFWVFNKFGVEKTSSNVAENIINNFIHVGGGFLYLKLCINATTFSTESYFPYFWSMSNVPSRYREVLTLLHIRDALLSTDQGAIRPEIMPKPPFRTRERFQRNGKDFKRGTLWLSLGDYLDMRTRFYDHKDEQFLESEVQFAPFCIRRERHELQAKIKIYMSNHTTAQYKERITPAQQRNAAAANFVGDFQGDEQPETTLRHLDEGFLGGDFLRNEQPGNELDIRDEGFLGGDFLRNEQPETTLRIRDEGFLGGDFLRNEQLENAPRLYDEGFLGGDFLRNEQPENAPRHLDEGFLGGDFLRNEQLENAPRLYDEGFLGGDFLRNEQPENALGIRDEGFLGGDFLRNEQPEITLRTHDEGFLGGDFQRDEQPENALRIRDEVLERQPRPVELHSSFVGTPIYLPKQQRYVCLQVDEEGNMGIGLMTYRPETRDASGLVDGFDLIQDLFGVDAYHSLVEEEGVSY